MPAWLVGYPGAFDPAAAVFWGRFSARSLISGLLWDRWGALSFQGEQSCTPQQALEWSCVPCVPGSLCGSLAMAKRWAQGLSFRKEKEKERPKNPQALKKKEAPDVSPCRGRDAPPSSVLSFIQRTLGSISSVPGLVSGHSETGVRCASVAAFEWERRSTCQQDSRQRQWEKAHAWRDTSSKWHVTAG